MRGNHRKWSLIVLGGALAGAAAFAAGHLAAEGIPPKEALTYSGVIEDGEGTPLTGEHRVQIYFWETGGGSTAANPTPLCLAPTTPLVLQAGRFSMMLPESCTQAVREHPDLWVEVLVDGVATGVSKLGAVPYAVEAEHAVSASSASGELRATLAQLTTRPELSSLVTVTDGGLGEVRLSGPPVSPSANGNLSVADAGVWVTVPGRELKFTKQLVPSRLKITYQDTLGSLGTAYNGCTWRISLDGTPVASFSDADLQGAPIRWKMNNAAHIAWANAAAGAHTVRVEWAGNTAQGAWSNTTTLPDGGTTQATQQCLAGWVTKGSFLSVEEIP